MKSQFEDYEIAPMQMLGCYTGNPSFLMQLQQQAVAEELDLQNDFMEENARLRLEGMNIDRIHKRIKLEAKQLKHERSSLKKWQASLKNSSKRIKAQEEQLIYKRQQIEKESIKINKSMQKLRRFKQTLEQAAQLASGLRSSEIFAKLRYEASLTQLGPHGNSLHEASDDWLLAVQAHEFVTNFEKVKQLLEHVISNNALRGGATGSGDLNIKLPSGGPTNPATVQTTQH